MLASLLVSSHLCSAAEIDHVVLLMMENRPFDFFFGHAGLPGADDLTKPQPGGTLEDYCNLYDTKDASKGKICPQKGKAYQVCRDGSSMSFHVYADDIFGPGVFNGASAPYPNVSTFGTGYLETNRGNEEIMWGMAPEQIPIKMALAREYAVFDKWHASFPGPSTPNHLFTMMASSAGCTETGSTYKCEPGGLFPAKTIFESLLEQNKTWAYYYNDTAWTSFMKFFHTDDGKAGMKGYDDFYHNAEHGTLPNFSFILPRQATNETTGQGPNDDHPCHDIALGERLIKDTYEALRASPAWNKTALLIMYDDPGGWYDHGAVPTGVPAPDNYASCPDQTDFTYLGARVTTILVSPWVRQKIIILYIQCSEIFTLRNEK